MIKLRIRLGNGINNAKSISGFTNGMAAVSTTSYKFNTRPVSKI